MSAIDTNSSSSDTLTAEFIDGRLQIVECSPMEAEGDEDPDASEDADTNYIHIINQSDEQQWQLDNLNLTLIRCNQQDGGMDYALVSDDNNEPLSQKFLLNARLSNESQAVDESKEMGDDNSSSYVIMFNPEEVGDDEDGEYVVLDNNKEATDTDNDSYVVVHGKEGPMMFLQSQLKITQPPTEPIVPLPIVDKKPPPTTAFELLQKAKALKKAKELLRKSLCNSRTRAAALPSPEQLLQSPNFKIYLYSCKLCDFQCNGIKQMTEHKATEHLKKKGNSKARYPYKNSLGGGRPMQCARCPFRASVISELLTHAQEKHPVSADSVKDDVPTGQRVPFLGEHERPNAAKQEDNCNDEATSPIRTKLEVTYESTELKVAAKAREKVKKKVKGRPRKEICINCNECSYTANNHTQMFVHFQEQHSKENQEEEALICHTCGVQASGQSDLDQHIQEVHAYAQLVKQ